MQIHQIIKDTLTEHKQKIELTQWAIMSGISSLVYSEYIRRFKHKETPVRSVMVPPIKCVQDCLNMDSEFMKFVSDHLIEDIKDHVLIKKYIDAPELVMFREENSEVMKTIFDLYIIPNISRRIPETISKKFGLDQENQQIFRESFEIDIFDHGHIPIEQYKFIVEEIVLQLLLLLPTMKKEIEVPEDRMNIQMSRNEILTIANENAICPIHFNRDIIQNKTVIDLLSFITNTTFNDITDGDIAPQKRNEIVQFLITTGAFNQIILTRLIGIEFE